MSCSFFTEMSRKEKKIEVLALNYFQEVPFFLDRLIGWLCRFILLHYIMKFLSLHYLKRTVIHAGNSWRITKQLRGCWWLFSALLITYKHTSVLLAPNSACLQTVNNNRCIWKADLGISKWFFVKHVTRSAFFSVCSKQYKGALEVK